MNLEHDVVRLKGVKTDLKRYIALGEFEYTRCISEIGTSVAQRLDKIAPALNGNDKLKRMILWDFEGSNTFDGKHEEVEQFGLYLECDDFYVDKIHFIRDDNNKNVYRLVICGCSNFECDLFSISGSELQVVFYQMDDKLTYQDVLILGYQMPDHMVKSQLDIGDQAKLKIMSIADRATNIFTRMELVKDRPAR